MSLEVEYKGVQIGQLTSDGTLTLETAGMYCEDDIELTYSGGGGGSSVEGNDVNFIDYDGTIVASYTASEFAQLAEYPTPPDHADLTFSVWNWPMLETAKTYVAKYGVLDIGAVYLPKVFVVSGEDVYKTDVDIELRGERRSPCCGLAVQGRVGITWGDDELGMLVGSDLTTVVDTTHTYANGGRYTIELVPFPTFSTNFAILSNSVSYTKLLHKSPNPNIPGEHLVYANAIKNVRVGRFCSIGAYAFNCCSSLESITMPLFVSSIGDYAFQGCSSLKSITIPTMLTSIGAYAFSNCTSLKSVSMPMPFRNELTIGNRAFYGCSSLSSITIPDSVTSIGDYAFYDCSSLSSITIPDSVNSIGDYAFASCYSLAAITIPDSVNSIGSGVFYTDCGLGEIHFKSSSPPTVGNSNAWTYLSTDCKIYVPAGSLSAYTSATNYPSSSSYTYIEE